MSLSNDDFIRDNWNRGRSFLGCEHAILGGAMSWLSEHRLVSAISEAGGFGVLASGNMPPELFRQEIRRTRERTSRPFGVNLITLNPELDQLVRVTVEEGVGHCVLAGGVADPRQVAPLTEAGVKVMMFAPTLALAKRLQRRGADALIIEGHEAGGHVGPVSTAVLAQEILPVVREVPVFVAGGIASGDMVRAMVALGAAGCQVGTLFVCTDECIAHARFKQAFIRAQARDAAVTAQFDPALPVIPVRALQNEGVGRFNALQLELLGRVKAGELAREAAILELERFWVGALRRAAIDGDVENGSVMAGQSVGLVKDIRPVARIIADLIAALP
ncbi:MAG: nitronate monooxygenase [Magnetococcus sp. WYHC-3]